MFCPKCKSEYREGMIICPECDEKLVIEIPKVEYVKLVTVFCTGDMNLLAIAKSLLKDANINYFTLNERLLGYVSSGVAEIKVSEDDLEEAENLLKELKYKN